jgi:lysophospholipase L1-like esterase
MLRFDLAKYLAFPERREQLLLTATRGKLLIEDIPTDVLWGTGRGYGLNLAGLILMEVRDHIQGIRSLPNVYVAGDSITKGLGPHLPPNFDVVSLPGAEWGFVLNAARWITGPQTSTIIMMAGTNNLSYKTPLPTAANPKPKTPRRRGPRCPVRNIPKFAHFYAQEHPTVHVYLSGILNRPRDANVPRMAKRPAEFNRLLKEQFEREAMPKTFHFLEVPPFPEDHFADGLHLNDRGSRALAALYAAIPQH